MANIVQFENVGLRYGTGPETLSDISFTLQSGAFYFLTGASGAGKTSLLRLLYLALRPTRGVTKHDMVNNSALPAIAIDPETFAIRIDGDLVEPAPATELPLAQLYSLF